MCVRESRRQRGRGKDGGPLFISVPQALLGICVLCFQPKCNLSPGLIQSVCSSSVQTQSLTLTCNPFPRHHQRCFGNNETHLSNRRQSCGREGRRISMRCLVTLMKGVLTRQRRVSDGPPLLYRRELVVESAGIDDHVRSGWVIYVRNKELVSV